MKWAAVCVFLIVNVVSWTEGYRLSRFATDLRKALIAPLVVLSLGASPAFAKDAQVYFGVGCYWHTQHEFVEAEKSILGRTDDQLTSKTGYAGGTRVGKDGKVCYHNLQGVADYGSLGHGEVVGLDVPEDKVKDISKAYFSLFGSDNERPDKGDRGPEYRSLLGLPGGVKSPLFPQVEAAAKEKGVDLKLVEGKGDDPDTLGKKIVWVMDTAKFPFYQAELYHQYHDGFMMGEQYPESYNDLAKKAFAQGRLQRSGCPDTNF